MLKITVMDTNLISSFILLITLYFIKNIEDEQKKIVMFWVLFIVFTIMFAILSNM